MRTIVTLAACLAVGVCAVPAIVVAQSSTTTTTTNNYDPKVIWEKIQGSWTQTKGAVKEQWGKLTDDDLLEIRGRREQLVGKIQTRYGISHEQAEAQVSGWERHYKSM
jgi:uncharacterized protein YjbJ (UPF0337 family)